MTFTYGALLKISKSNICRHLFPTPNNIYIHTLTAKGVPSCLILVRCSHKQLHNELDDKSRISCYTQLENIVFL